MERAFSPRRAACVASLLLALLLSGCASSLKEIPIETVRICEKGRCASLGKEVNVDSFLSRVYAFLVSHIDQDTSVAEADPESGKATGSNIKYFTQGGPLPFYAGIDTVKFTEVLFLDREKREIRFKLRPWSHFLGVPVLCAEGEGALTVVSPQDVSLEVSALCTWMLVGTSNWQMKMRLDRIDLDRDTLAGYYSVGHAGPLTVGKGSGYQVARFQPPAFTPDIKNAPALSAVASPSEPPSGLRPELTYTTIFSDSSNDAILDPGEKVSLSIEVANTGKAEAQDVSIILTGTPFLVEILGARKEAGSIPPDTKIPSVFEAVLPRQIPIDAADVRVEVREGKGFSAAENRNLRFAARRVEKHETVQVISQPPLLEYSLELKGFLIQLF